jgi:XTP/dITP diphosphohydrolase
MIQLCLASRNQHKIAEIQSLVGEGFKILSLDEIGCLDELPETCPTIAANSLQKAQYVWDNFKVNCFADDSGLEVEALNGEPGVDTAFYSGSRDADANITLLLKNLAPFSNRNARFVTVISLILEGELYQFEGEVRGEIIFEKRGQQGFGYDPIFKPLGYERTFAEMAFAEKNPISHRGRAVQQLIDFLKRK